MSNHFAYLIEDQSREFFTGLRKTAIDRGLTKEASTLGEMVSSIPRAAAVLKPKLSKIRKFADGIEAELEILRMRTAGDGAFGMFKGAEEVMVELQLDPESTREELDAVFDKLAGTALAHDLKKIHDEVVPGQVTEAEFVAWGRTLLKEGGLFSSAGRALAGKGLFKAEGALAGLGRAGRAAATESRAIGAGFKGVAKTPLSPIKGFGAERAEAQRVGRAAEMTRTKADIPGLAAKIKTMPLGAERASLSGRFQDLVAHKKALAPKLEEATRKAGVLSGNVVGSGTASPTAARLAKGKGIAPTPPAPASTTAPTGAGVGASTAPPAAASPGVSVPPPVPMKGPGGKGKGRGKGPKTTAPGTGAAATGKPAGMMDSINKFLRGEKLSPEERAHVIKAGMGAYLLHEQIAPHNG